MNLKSKICLYLGTEGVISSGVCTLHILHIFSCEFIIGEYYLIKKDGESE